MSQKRALAQEIRLGLGTTLTRSSLFRGSEFGLWDRAGTWKLSHSSGLTTRSTPPATLQIPSCHVIGQYPDKFTDVTDQKPDTVLLHHRAVSRHSSVTSQGSIQTQFCYVTGQYPDTVLLRHRAVQFCYVMGQYPDTVLLCHGAVSRHSSVMSIFQYSTFTSQNQ